MTIICVSQSPTLTVIGSDRQSGAGQNIISDPKWVVHNGWALGISGHHRAQELAEVNRERIFIASSSPHGIGLELRNCFLDDGFEPARNKDGSGWQNFDQLMLLVSRDGIWSMDSCLCSAPVREPFMAEGSGREIANGAVFAAMKTGMEDPAALVRMAVEAAIELDDGCGGEAWVDVLE